MKRKRLFIKVIGIPLTLFFILTGSVKSGISVQSDSIDLVINETKGIFETEEMLDITLKFDITEYMRSKPDEEYLDAVITIYQNSTDSVSYNIKLRARGESRRGLCSFPPIRLNLKETSTIYGDIDSMNVKMVTHCNPSKVFDEYVMKEYLAYKLYNLVTEYSFRVRLLRIKYIDTGKRGRYFEKYGFIIEPLDLMEKRLSVFEIETVPLTFSDLEPDLLDRMTIFQYMIGNPDWQIPSYHNIKIVKGREQIRGVAVPYDFDYSGLVNTYYAIPAKVLNIENVRQRIYMGACRSDSTYKRILNEFKINRENILNSVEDFEYLDKRPKKHVMRYLEDFFKLLEKDRLANIFKINCKET